MSDLKKNYAYEFKFQWLFKKILISQRKKFFKIFCDEIIFHDTTKILDIGAANVDNEYDNFFIKEFPYKKNIFCLSDQELDILKNKYPEINTIKGDGRKIDLPSNSFDIIFSNAVLEHVGSNDQQKDFISECYRVTNKNVFIITPYRFFPIEMHTKIPLLHFFPKSVFRNILRFFGEKFLSEEKNLNLLSENDLKNICNKLNIDKYKIKYSYFLDLSPI